MPALNYVGISGNSPDPLVILGAANCENIVKNMPVNRAYARSLIRSGWTGTGGFVGTNNFLTNSTVSTDSKSLLNLLTYKGNAADPCIQYSELQDEAGKYVANSSIGVAGGVASTDSNNYIPLAQLPSMGSGYLIGPFGGIPPNSPSAPAASSGPLKIVEWPIGPVDNNFQPLVFMVVNARTNDNLGRSVIEVRISNGPSTTYSNQHTLVSVGTGRSFYTGLQPIVVLPCAPANGRSGSTAFSASYNTHLTAWLYDAGASTSSVSNPSAIICATAFLMRA